MAREQVKRKSGAAAAEIGAGALVRDGAIVDGDPWVLLEDDAPIDGDSVVSVQRLLREGASLLGRRNGRMGVLIAPSDAVEDIASHLSELAIVMVSFPAFRDGRGFTTARLLRERYNFSGELRAVGDVLEDQVFFMLRCGFDSFDLRARDPLAAYERARARYSAFYQSAPRGGVDVRTLRRGETP